MALIQPGNLVGLIPAAGFGTRLSPLPFSKELYPIGLQVTEDQRGVRPKVVTHYLLEKMRAAGVSKAYVVLRNGKWDIPAYFGSGIVAGVDLAYVVTGLSYGPPYTLDAAYGFVRDSLVVFGFPDIVFDGESAFAALLNRQMDTSADVVLGLFPAVQPEIMDMVRLDKNGGVDDVVIRPAKTALNFCWAIAVWSPHFTKFLHEHLQAQLASAASGPELSVGHVIQAAVRAGLRVDGVPVSDKPFQDIGTPEGLEQALQTLRPRFPIPSDDASIGS
jgi:glucose-1-phosphate thymidylyltransferase